MIRHYAKSHLLVSLLKCAVPVIALGAIGISSAKADVFLYNVAIPTNDLYADSSDAPYTIFVELDGTADNTVTLSDFSPAASEDPITLDDSSGFDSAEANFVPSASSLSFNLSTTNNQASGPNPDELSFYILDDNGTNIVSTTDPGSSLFTIDLGGSSPTVTTFTGTDNFSDVSPTVTPSTATPEPSPLVSLAVAFLGLGMLISTRKRARVNN